MTRLRLALVLLVGCASDEPPAPLEHRFATRPVRVQASEELPEACLLALDQTVIFYAGLGATLQLSVVPLSASSVSGVPVGGVVGVLPGRLSMDVHGETSLALTVGGNVFAAEVVLASCEDRAVAHELGHALGLVHVAELGNLMYPALAGGGWALDDEQRGWIADE